MRKYILRRTCFLCVFLASYSFAFSASAAEMVSVKGDKVNMRSGPGIQHKVKWEYGAGFPFEVMKKHGDWLQVKDFEDETGWIHKSHVRKAPHMIVRANKDQEQAINIRSGPGNDNAIIGSAYHGVVFSMLEVKSGWVKVQHESGFTGWIKKSLLWGF